MPLAQVVAGNRILASDLNQFYNILKGVAASGENVTLIYNAGALTLQPSSDPAAGTRVVTIKNNAGTTLASWRYDGLLEMLSAAAAPATAIAGSVYWDTVLSALRVNDGTNWRDLAGGNTGPLPNLVLNSDFSRRTVFGLAMPEVFADLSGTTKIDGGAAGSVAANIFTQGAANNEYAWCAGSFVWRDGRMSATFKATSTTGIYRLRWRISATDYIEVRINNGNFDLVKVIASTPTTMSTSPQALTLNNWYWLEVEKQGTTFIAKVYNTAVTTPGTLKSASTLLQTITGVSGDASVAVGAHISISSDQAAAQWGGIATGNGGVYVETWLPESWASTHLGTLGGQAIGFDESVDAGPLGKQWAMRAYIPATSRRIRLYFNADTSNIPSRSIQVTPSVAYTGSVYVKVSGASGALTNLTMQTADGSLANAATPISVTDAAETSWTRKTAVATLASTARYAYGFFEINPGTSQTGTAYFMLPQLEQGSAATAWRNAPSDFGPIVWSLASSRDIALTAAGEVDSRDLAANIFLPWDANVAVDFAGVFANSGANTNYVRLSVAGGSLATVIKTNAGTTLLPISAHVTAGLAPLLKLAAGKPRIAMTGDLSAGTETFYGSTHMPTHMTITATMGK